MKERITILTGAGLTASRDFFDITTLGLTQSLITYSHPELTDDKDFLGFVYSEFCFWNNLDPSKTKENLYQINFETILQIIEELFSYIEDYERTKHKVKSQNSVKNTVYSLNRRLIYRISQVRIPKFKDGIYFFIEKVYNHLIDEIIVQLNTHNENANNKGMEAFTNFLHNNFQSSKTIRRLYTLNYDNWLHKHAGYFDGFSGDTFNSTEVITNRDIDCHYNLHGCILWSWMTYKKLSSPQERKHSQSFTGYTISREALLPSPIISGYNKLTRINASPFLEIFHSFTTDCLHADKLLVIGYSFSDPHVNNNFKLVGDKVKIVIVVYQDVSCLTNEYSDFYRLTSELTDIFGSQFTKPSLRSGLKHTVDSDDNRISIFLNGIGQSFYDEYPLI